MGKLFHRWKESTDGATAIEYGLIAAGISLALVTVIFAFGDQIAVLMGQLKSALSG